LVEHHLPDGHLTKGHRKDEPLANTMLQRLVYTAMGQTFGLKASFYTAHVDQMSVCQMFVGQMSVGQMFFDQKTRNQLLILNESDAALIKMRRKYFSVKS
jgi:hypothetical protein